MSISSSIITRDVDELSEKTDNVYESINVISIRARQISSLVREELNGKLAEFASTVDNLEEIFENREQIEISKFYGRMPKPTQLAIDEFLNDELTYREGLEDTESEN